MRLNYYKRYLFIFFVLLQPFSTTYAFFFDLESYTQDFILETKKIEIPHYPHAFNPSIIRWRKRILMSFRFRDPISTVANHIALVWLDEEFNPTSPPQIIKIPAQNPSIFAHTQDPRLVEINSELFIVFNGFCQTSLDPNRRMAYSKLIENQEVFSVDTPYYLLNFKNESAKKQEKNWVPFDFQGKLFFSYSIEPHLVLKPIAHSINCQTIDISSSSSQWNWGVLRGGTPAQIIDGHYLAFFHSVKNMISLQSNGQCIPHYFMGAYAFNSNPPFNMTKISPEPLIGQNFYNGPNYITWRPLLVVFPGGYIHDEKYIWIAYGRQDHEVWIVKLDKRALLNSLIPIYPVPSD